MTNTANPSYINQCKTILEQFQNHQMETKEIITPILDDVAKKIDTSQNIIFCGAMSFANNVARYLVELGKNVFYLDRLLDEGLFNGCPIVSFDEVQVGIDIQKTLFVITSRSGVSYYRTVLGLFFPDCQIISYEPMLLLYPDQANISQRVVYTEKGIREGIQSIQKHAAEYIEDLDILQDDISKDILSRVILFRLSWNLDLNKDIISSYADYMDEDVYCLSDGEIVLDAGGYNGDSLYDFEKAFDEKEITDYHYFLFEPSTKNIEAAKKVPHDSQRVSYVCSGLGNQISSAVLSGGDIISTLKSADSKAGEQVSITTIDEYFQGKPVTLIKMDIEGSEPSALRGVPDNHKIPAEACYMSLSLSE